MDHLIKAGWRWVNEPARWHGDTIVADAGTDFWRATHYGYTKDSGHLLGVDRSGDFTLTATIAGDYTAQYDQAGLALRADERNWIKCGIELVDGRQVLSVVVTREFSDWSMVELAVPAASVTLTATRAGDAVTVSYGLDGAPPATALRLAYFPPELSVLAGVMCASPTGQGFATRFADVTA